MAFSPRVRRVATWLVSIAGVTAAAVLGLGCGWSAPGWKGPVTDHFDGTRFHTPGAAAMNVGLSQLLKWQTERNRGVWRERREEPPGPPPPREVGPGQLRVTFINHATTLLQLDGVNVITDPIYSERASPVDFIGPRRVRPPGIRFEDLPRIDAIVISHNHYDHLDLPTLKRLVSTWPKAIILVGLGNKRFLEGRGFRQVVELDWWDSREVAGVKLTSVPVQHFSARGLFDRDQTLWTGWVLEGSRGRAFFAGDTGYGPHFKTVGDKLGPFRLAVLPIGAFKPEWFMGPIHESPAQAAQAAVDLRASMAVPMHYGTFELADDGETEPVEALQAAMKATGAPFVVLGFGEGRDVPEVTP